MIHITTKCKSINSKRLFTEIDKVVKDGLFSVELSWLEEENREIIVGFLNSIMQEYCNTGVIEQWKVQCNMLNNTINEMLQGEVNLDIYYKQKHCLNTSQITYTIIE